MPKINRLPLTTRLRPVSGELKEADIRVLTETGGDAECCDGALESSGGNKKETSARIVVDIRGDGDEDNATNRIDD